MTLSQQTFQQAYFCHDKGRVLLQQTHVCHDKHIFDVTKLRGGGGGNNPNLTCGNQGAFSS